MILLFFNIKIPLKLLQVSRYDAGEYDCAIITPDGVVFNRKSIFVEVMRAPIITLNPPTQIVHPGQSPTVDCVVDGDEITDITWKPLDKALSRLVSFDFCIFYDYLKLRVVIICM